MRNLLYITTCMILGLLCLGCKQPQVDALEQEHEHFPVHWPQDILSASKRMSQLLADPLADATANSSGQKWPTVSAELADLVGWLPILAADSDLGRQDFARIDSSLYMLLAIVGVGVLAMLLPAGVLQRAAGKDDTIAPLTMSAVATLAYITPMTAIMQVASMFQHGNSVAAAFALLTLGTGVNLGLLVWMIQHYSFRRSLVWLGCLVGIVLAMSYSLDRPLRPKGIEPADHTHAFDTYCNPFVKGEQNYWESAKRVLQEAATPAETVALGLCGVLLGVGGLLSRFDPQKRIMRWLVQAPTLYFQLSRLIGFLTYLANCFGVL